MKILISTKYLASYLHAFDLDTYPIARAGYFDGDLVLESDEYHVSIPCQKVESDGYSWCDQYDTRWDWLENTLRSIPDQPAILNIEQYKLQLILTF